MRGFCLEVAGPFACFTRPEMKVERVSYDVITPSAARNIYQAIFWKPAIQWRIKRIDVLSPIRWISFRRNEVASCMSEKSKGLFVEDDREQRVSLLLRDVKYRIYAGFDFIPPSERTASRNPAPEWLADGEEHWLYREAENHPDEKPAKYAAMFERRARKGQCFTQPYLGCREFSCSFRLVDQGADPVPAISETRDLGWMLYDFDYSDSNNIVPMFFRAQLNNGSIFVPNVNSKEVVK